jgi:ectoine hydroxylase-related dioxygenase (phytanoyl-CoA dioxygenase family)
MPSPHPELLLSSMTALSDFTIENGATMVVPDSDQGSTAPTSEGGDAVVHAVMPAGSTVIYLGSTLHAAGSNTTADQWRIGLHLSYTLGWLRTEENNYLGCPPAVAAALPQRSQEVIGYRIHNTLNDGGGYLGMLDLQDPLMLLKEGRLS